MDPLSSGTTGFGPVYGPAVRIGRVTEFANMAWLDSPGAGGGSGDGASGRSGRRPRPEKLYRIGEVVAYSGLSRQTVHNYTTMGLLRTARWTDGGHRLYDESVFERLDEIAAMKTGGKGLQEIREHFSGIDQT